MTVVIVYGFIAALEIEVFEEILLRVAVASRFDKCFLT